jgi:hypothetical protein
MNVLFVIQTFTKCFQILYELNIFHQKWVMCIIIQKYFYMLVLKTF